MPTIVYEQHWDTDNGTPDDSLNAAFVASPFHTATGSLRINPTAATGYWLKNVIGTTHILVYQVAIQFTTLPNADVSVLVGFIAGSADLGLAYITATKQFATYINTVASHVAAGGPVITTGQWYILDLLMNVNTGSWTVDAKVNGTALTQATDTFVQGTFPDYRIADSADNSTQVAYYDDFYVSHTLADYPISLSVNATVAWWGAAG